MTRQKTKQKSSKLWFFLESSKGNKKVVKNSDRDFFSKATKTISERGKVPVGEQLEVDSELYKVLFKSQNQSKCIQFKNQTFLAVENRAGEPLTVDQKLTYFSDDLFEKFELLIESHPHYGIPFQPYSFFPIMAMEMENMFEFSEIVFPEPPVYFCIGFLQRYGNIWEAKTEMPNFTKGMTIQKLYKRYTQSDFFQSSRAHLLESTNLVCCWKYDDRWNTVSEAKMTDKCEEYCAYYVFVAYSEDLKKIDNTLYFKKFNNPEEKIEATKLLIIRMIL